MQLIGLDRFVTRGTWEIMNLAVVQEVISNLDLDTMELSKKRKFEHQLEHTKGNSSKES